VVKLTYHLPARLRVTRAEVPAAMSVQRRGADRRGDWHLTPGALMRLTVEVPDTEPFRDPSLTPSGAGEVAGILPPILERPVQVEECLCVGRRGDYPPFSQVPWRIWAQRRFCS